VIRERQLRFAGHSFRSKNELAQELHRPTCCWQRPHRRRTASGNEQQRRMETYC